MTQVPSAGTIYSYPDNPRVYKALIAAQYNGVHIDLAKDFQLSITNKTPEFLAKFPLGKVPAMDTPDGPLFESNAIMYYVASLKQDTQLFGEGKYQASLVQQFIGFADNEIAPAAATWLYPILGYVEYHEASTRKAKEDMQRALHTLNKILSQRTYLVGNRVTLADIALVCALVSPYLRVLDSHFREPYVNVNRWFVTVVNQPEVKAILGEVKLCEQMEVYKPENLKKPKEEKKPEKKEEKKPQQPSAADLEDEIEAEEKEREKVKNPLDLLPKSPLVLDEWKRFYSNNETRPDAVNWFWQHFDAEGYSMWRIVYKYNDELDLIFKSSNLIGGFFQRLERVRKYAFGSMAVYGEDKNNIIAGMFIFRGQDIPAEVTEVADFESFEFTKVDVTDEKIKEEWNACIAWDGNFQGKPFADGKVYK